MNRKTDDYNDENRQRRFAFPDAGYSGAWESMGYDSRDTDYRPGYSTANDFSEKESPFARSRRRGRDYSAHSERGRQRGEYPETYRSAMSGYMSEHVGDDIGRRDYNPNASEGNLYGRRYSLRENRRSMDYQRGDERGYMSEDDYDRGSHIYRESMGYPNEYRRGYGAQGLHKGKGPRNYKRTDSRIQEDINDRLTEDAMVDASAIDVSVQNGEVTLTGTVDSRDEKRRAEDIVESVRGVVNTENRIRVRSGTNVEQPPVVTPY